MATPAQHNAGDRPRPDQYRLPGPADKPASHDAHGHDHGAGGRRWMMIACCAPMLVIAVVLVATGVVGVGFLFVAIMCTLMTAAMHGGMVGGKDHH